MSALEPTAASEWFLKSGAWIFPHKNTSYVCLSEILLWYLNLDHVRWHDVETVTDHLQDHFCRKVCSDQLTEALKQLRASSLELVQLERCSAGVVGRRGPPQRCLSERAVWGKCPICKVTISHSDGWERPVRPPWGERDTTISVWSSDG